MFDQPLSPQNKGQDGHLRRYTAVLAASVQVTSHPGNAHEIVNCALCRFITSPLVNSNCGSACPNISSGKGFSLAEIARQRRPDC